MATSFIAVAALASAAEARYLWHPNEASEIHQLYQLPPAEHHIVNFAAPAAESSEFRNAEPTASKKDQTNTQKKEPSSTPTSASNPKPSSEKPVEHSSKAASTPAATSKSNNSNTKPSGSNSGSTSNGASSTPLMPLPTSNDASSAVSATSSLSPSSSTAPSTEERNGGTSSGAVAGIVIGILAVIGAIAAFVMIRRKKRSRRNMNPDPFTMGFGSHDTPPPLHDSYNNNNNNNISDNNNNGYQQYSNGGMSQPYQTPQPAHMSPMSPTYNTPPPPLSPMSDVPPYQQQQYYTQPVEKTQANIAPVAIDTAVAGAGLTAGAMATEQHQQPYQQTPPQQQQQGISQGSLGVFNVVSTYSPTLSDEIDIQLGDRIEILVEYDDGWCQGVNLTRGNAKGVFPRHCVEQYPGAHEQQIKNDGPPQLELGSLKRVSSMYMPYS